MRAAMCFTHFHLSRCQIRTFSGSWWKNVKRFDIKGENTSKFQLLSPNLYCLQGGNSRKWTQKSLCTKTEGKNILNTKTNDISQQITDIASLTLSDLNTSRVDISEPETVQIEPELSENKDISKLITIICFDIETTGFSRENDRIIEIALQDLSGGVNSTFETLVNPDRMVTNSHVHGISSYNVNSPGVPRMKELIPILVRYVRSREKVGGQTILIAHNGKSFDVPFLMNEFGRCDYEIPSDWLFLDTMFLARRLMKVEGSILSSKSLKSLREYYNIPLIGQAHRAMADVKILVSVLQRMTRDLKLSIPNLVENYTFKPSETSTNSKKKTGK